MAGSSLSWGTPWGRDASSTPGAARLAADREAVVAALRAGQEPDDIALRLGRHRTTIYRYAREAGVPVERRTRYRGGSAACPLRPAMSRPSCFREGEWATWLAANDATDQRALSPCDDCSAEFEASMRAEDRCNAKEDR